MCKKEEVRDLLEIREKIGVSGGSGHYTPIWRMTRKLLLWETEPSCQTPGCFHFTHNSAV